MICGNELSEWDDKAIQDALDGKNTALDADLQKELESMVEPTVELLNKLDRIIEGADTADKDVLDPEVRQQINRSIPTMVKLQASLVDDDQRISIVPPVKDEIAPEIVAEHLRIIAAMPDEALIYRMHTEFFNNSVKEGEAGTPAKVFLEMPGMTKGNLILMMNNYAPLGPDGKPMNLHHWRREDQGPRWVLSKGTHDKFSKGLHDHDPSKEVRRSPFNKERKDFWQKCTQEYLGDWYDDISNVLLNSQNN